MGRPFFTVAWSEGTWLRPHHRTRYLQVSGSILSTQRKERPQYTQMHTRTHIHREIRVREASQVKREKEGEKGPPRASRQRQRSKPGKKRERGRKGPTKSQQAEKE